MSQQKGFSAIEILVALAVFAILAGGVWVWRGEKIPSSSPAPTPTTLLTPIPTQILISTTVPTKPAEEPMSSPTPVKINIPPDWSTFERKFTKPHFEGIHLSFRHPTTHGVSADSEPLEIFKKGSPFTGTVKFNVLIRRLGTWQEYQSGSRRVWFKSQLQKTWPDIDFSGLQFEEVSFDNGKRYLKVSNWPADLLYKYKESFCFPPGIVHPSRKCTYYLGIQNGVSFYLRNDDEEGLSHQDILGVLYSLIITPTSTSEESGVAYSSKHLKVGFVYPPEITDYLASIHRYELGVNEEMDPNFYPSSPDQKAYLIQVKTTQTDFFNLELSSVVRGSTSGSVCANSWACEKVRSQAVSILGKNIDFELYKVSHKAQSGDVVSTYRLQSAFCVPGITTSGTYWEGECQEGKGKYLHVLAKLADPVYFDSVIDILRSITRNS